MENVKLQEVKKGIGEQVSEVFAGIGFGITVLLLFALLWIPIIAVLLAEYNWLLN